MSKVSVFDNGWIDLVFEGRNHKYGAYQLRRQDSRTTLIALISGIGLIGALVGIPAAYNYLSRETAMVVANNPEIPGIEVHDIELPPIPEPPKPLPSEAAAPAPKDPQPTIELKPLAPTSGPVEKDPPTTTQVQQTNTGQTTNPGDGSNRFVTGPTSPDGKPGDTGTGTSTSGSGNGIVDRVMVDEEPEFPGGLDKFRQYIGKNFKTPDVDNATTMKVYVSFVVEKDGTLSNIKVQRDPGYGMGQEAIRVLKSLKTPWKPGKVKGQSVRTAYNIPITVQVH